MIFSLSCTEGVVHGGSTRQHEYSTTGTLKMGIGRHGEVSPHDFQSHAFDLSRYTGIGIYGIDRRYMWW